MGSYAPAPVLTDALRDEAVKTILEPYGSGHGKEGGTLWRLPLCRPYD